MVPVSDFLKWFQIDCFNNRVKLLFFLSFAIFIYNESKTSVNPMVWRCREFFLQYFRFKNVCSTICFWFFYCLGYFLFLGIELCAQRIIKQTLLILWYGVAASSFFPRSSFFYFVRPEFFGNLFCWVIFLF